MQNYRTRAQLKQDAKNTLRGRWGTGILLYLIPMLISWFVGAGNLKTSTFTMNGDPAHLSFSANQSGPYFILFLAIGLVLALIYDSADFQGLDWIRNPELQFQPLQSNFSRFKNPDWYKLMGINIIYTVLVWLWTLLLVIPGIIKTISYSQAFFIYKDLSDKGQADGYSLMDFITRSRRMMNGHKMDYFVLQLSFIGWFILGAISFGIGYLWIIPYYRLTMANYYRDLAENNPKLV